MASLTQVAGSFALGLATPLTAVCVLPLYPGFLAYLASQSGSGDSSPSDDSGRSDRDGQPDDGGGSGDPSIGLLAGLVAAGVISFMLVLGVVFTTVLQVSLTNVVGVVSLVAFALLGGLGLLLLADVDVGRRLPSVEPPQSRRPVASAFGYGFFFGAIVVPCNPGFVAVFFARAFLFSDPVGSLLHFLAFGGGIAAPLVALAVASDRWRSRVLGLLTSHRSLVNRATGAVMVGVAAYYLVVVFGVVPLVG